jgi:3-isopropylmalate dehydratase small subunit
MSNVIRGAARLLPAEVSTDLHCSSKYLPGKDNTYIAQHAFEQVSAGFPARFQPGDVIVAGANFGINSSREQAVHVMQAMGVAAIVAPSFHRQFYRNAINNGFTLVECEVAQVAEGDSIEIDLTRGEVRVPARGLKWATPPLPAEIQALLAAGGLIPFLKQHPDWKLI